VKWLEEGWLQASMIAERALAIFASFGTVGFACHLRGQEEKPGRCVPASQ
jgi:hypothetical protein